MVEYYFVLLSRETCERQYDFSKESNIITKRWKVLTRTTLEQT